MPPSELLATLALIDASPPVGGLAGGRAREAVHIISAMTLAAIVAILAVGIVGILLIRRHRRRLPAGETVKRRRRPPPDPWFEAARRIPDPEGGPKSRVISLPRPDKPDPSRRGSADDDTVDIDPDELDRGDVGGGDDDDDGTDPPSPRPPSRGG